VRVCTPFVDGFSEAFTLSFGEQNRTVIVNTRHSPPSPPPSPPPPTFETTAEDASTAANFSAVAVEELAAVVSVDSKNKVAVAQEESVEAATQLANITSTSAAAAANRTATAAALIAVNAAIDIQVAAQGAIDVANIATTGVTTAMVAASLANNIALNAALAANADAYATSQVIANARLIAAALAASTSAAADATASNTCAGSTLEPSTAEAIAIALTESAKSDAHLAELLEAAHSATNDVDAAYATSLETAADWRLEVVMQGDDARKGAVDVYNIATTGISTAMVAAQHAENVIKVANKAAIAAAALALVGPTITIESIQWGAYDAAKVIQRGQANLCVNAGSAIDEASNKADEAAAYAAEAAARLEAFGTPSPPPQPELSLSSPSPPPRPLAPPPVEMVAVVAGSVTVDGYTVDTFGENETTAFASAVANLMNVSADNVNVTVGPAGRRKLLVAQIAISYSITVPDVAAAESLQASIIAVPPADLIVHLKAVGLDEVSAVLIVVSDDILLCPVEPVPAPAEVPAPLEPATEVYEVAEQTLVPAPAPAPAPAPEPEVATEVYEVAEQTPVPAPAPAPAPAPEPEVAPDMANYVVGAVDILGITPETFGVNGTIVFENTTAEEVGLTAPSVKIVTVEVPPEEEADDTYEASDDTYEASDDTHEASEGRRRLLNGFGGAARVRFVIKATDRKIASSVRTLLKSALRDNPERFAESLRSNGLETVTGVLEVPPDLSTARKTLTAPAPKAPRTPTREAPRPSRPSGSTPPPPSAPLSPKLMDERLSIALVCLGFVLAMTVAFSCFAALNRKGGHTVTMAGAKGISLLFNASSVQSHRNDDSRGGCTDAPEYVTRKTVRSRRTPHHRMSE